MRHILNSSNVPNFNNTKHLLAADTGASHNCNINFHVTIGSIELQHMHMQVVLPSIQTMSFDKPILLPEPMDLLPEAKNTNVFTKLTEGSLTSIVQ